MDTIDEQLLQIMRTDATASSVALARRLMVSPATIRRRRRKLIQNGVLRVMGFVDTKKLGYNLHAVIGFNVEREKLDSVMSELADKPEVAWVTSTTGRFDVLALVELRSTDELANFTQRELLEVKGIKASETFICLMVKKRAYRKM